MQGITPVFLAIVPAYMDREYTITSQPATIYQFKHPEGGHYMRVAINGRSGVVTTHFMRCVLSQIIGDFNFYWSISSALKEV